MSDFIDAFNSIPEKDFPCPLQVLHKHVKGETRFNKYYNTKCLGCKGNTPQSEKSPEHRLMETMLKFKILAQFEQFVRVGKLTDLSDDDTGMPDGFDLFMKMSGQYN